MGISRVTIWVRGVIGGSWDLVTFYTWGYNPTYNWGNPYQVI